MCRDNGTHKKNRQIKKGCIVLFTSQYIVVTNIWYAKQRIKLSQCSIVLVFRSANGHFLWWSILSVREWGSNGIELIAAYWLSKTLSKNIKHQIGLINWVEYINFCYHPATHLSNFYLIVVDTFHSLWLVPTIHGTRHNESKWLSVVRQSHSHRYDKWPQLVGQLEFFVWSLR